MTSTLVAVEDTVDGIDFVVEADDDLITRWLGGDVSTAELLGRARSFGGSLFAAVCATGLLIGFAAGGRVVACPEMA